jgi:5,10-methylenetetrahydrofolate reductase
MCQAVSDAILLGIDSVLVLMGDEPANASGNSGLKPSAAVRLLRSEGYHAQIKLDLSFPAKISDRNSPAIASKFAAQPHSVVTQSIGSLSDLGEIVDLAKSHGVKVAACIMVPSEKNKMSASFVGVDWRAYEKNPVDFVKEAAKMADRVLLTSPNSFSSGIELLSQLGR